MPDHRDYAQGRLAKPRERICKYIPIHVTTLVGVNWAFVGSNDVDVGSVNWAFVGGDGDDAGGRQLGWRSRHGWA